MAIQYNIATIINTRLDEIEIAAGTAPLFRFYTGAMPAACATAASGTKLSDDALPSDWMSAASAGVKSKLGTWTLNGIAAGTAGYFRIYDSGAVACYVQGTASATGGGGDVTLDNAVIANAQVITVNTFSITGGNA